MSDLISRDAVIDNLERYRELFSWDDGDRERAILSRVIKELQSMPSAQPEIIRCKDCKHRDVEDGLCEGRGWPMQLVPDDGFCDKGERSES